MWLLYTDETNLEERRGDFFTYAGLALDCDQALLLSQTIDTLRRDAGVPRNFHLKFNPCPDELSHANFNLLKQAIIETAVQHGAKLLVSVILHDIATSPDDARRNGINTVCYHFDCLLYRVKSSGLVLIDRFSDRQIDAHLAEKFCIGVTGLPFSKEHRLSNVVGFHYSAIGQAHFTSVIDIVLGSLRFSINAFTRNDSKKLATARKLLGLIQPLFVRDGVQNSIPEISFFFSPKTIKVPSYREKYERLKAFLLENGIDTVQPIQAG